MLSEAFFQQLKLPESFADLGLGAEGQDLSNLLFSRPLVTLHGILDLYTAYLTLLLAFDLGWEPGLRRGSTISELLEGLRPPSTRATSWMLEFLAAKGMLVKEGERYRLEGDQILDLEELRQLAEREAPGHRANFDLLDAVRTHIRPYFTEGRSGEPLLFDLAVFPLWLDYFRNENLVYRVNNLATCIPLRAVLKPGARILELGGGVGSFAQMVSKDGASRGYLDRISEYRFTDITPTFLRRAQRELKTLAPGLPLSFSNLNINKPLDEQGLAGQHFDIILGINVLHVAKDLVATLKDLREHLASDGHLVLGECLKPDLGRPIYIEFFFNFMAGFTDVLTDPELRPEAGFLTPEVWDKVLRASGFSDVRHYPDARALMTHCPTSYVGAFAASR